MNNEFTYISNRCKAQLRNDAEFKAIKNKEDAAAYVDSNLDKMLNNMIARDNELISIFISSTQNGADMRKYLRDMTYNNINKQHETLHSERNG